MVSVCYILDVSADDWCWNTEYLLAFWIKLEETLTAEFLANLVALQMTDNRLSCNKVLLLLLVEEFQVQLIELWIEEHVNATFGCSYQAESGSCLDFLTIIGCDMNWQDWRLAAIVDVLEDIGGQVVNHCLGESETFKDAIRHLVLIEIVIHLLLFYSFFIWWLIYDRSYSDCA